MVAVFLQGKKTAKKKKPQDSQYHEKNQSD